MVPVTRPFAHEPPTPAETTLMVLETWLTTQASLSVRGLTETGPSPTGISASNWGLPGWVTSNTDSDEFAVFTANRNFPSAESRIGLVCEGSKFAGAGAADCAVAAAGVTMTATNLPCSPQIEIFHPPRAGSDWFAKVRNLQAPARPTAPWPPPASLSERVLR